MRDQCSVQVEEVNLDWCESHSTFCQAPIQLGLPQRLPVVKERKTQSKTTHTSPTTGFRAALCRRLNHHHQTTVAPLGCLPPLHLAFDICGGDEDVSHALTLNLVDRFKIETNDAIDWTPHTYTYGHTYTYAHTTLQYGLIAWWRPQVSAYMLMLIQLKQAVPGGPQRGTWDFGVGLLHPEVKADCHPSVGPVAQDSISVGTRPRHQASKNN